MSKYFIGVDGGGTKTHACLIDSAGKVISTAANGAANWERIGVVSAQRSLSEVIDEVISSANLSYAQITGITLALAGIDWGSDTEIFVPFVESIGLSQGAAFINDAIAALYAGVPSGIGCASIAGTGGKTVAQDGKTVVKTMGMSLGEGGGAGQLMDLAIHRMAQAIHGQASQTDMNQIIPTFFGMDNAKTFFKAIARDDLHIPEELAPLVFQAAAAQDAGAQEVVAHVARQHAKDVIGLVGQLTFNEKGFDVVRAGGLHTAGSETFDKTFEETLTAAYPHARPHVLQIAPVIGAAIHAATQNMGPLPDPFLKEVFSGARQATHF